MSRWRRSQADEGFSLVEVMVAMLIFAVVAVSGLAFITTALTATSQTRLEGVAKNLSQERLEGMRNLSYSISATVSAAPDLLDTYYTSTSSPAASTTTTGWVSNTGARNASQGDPATGAFFRRVFAPGSIPGYPSFSQRITAQFMVSASDVLPNPVFNSGSTGLDGLPPAGTLAVQVTTLWPLGAKTKVFTVYSQIADTANKPPLVTLQARLAALRFVGILPAGREVVAEAGVLNLDGSLSNSTSASASAQGALAAIANGARVEGAKQSLSAPPSASIGPAGEGVKTLSDGGTIAELSTTGVTGMAVSATNGQPGVGTATQALIASLKGGGFGDVAFSATNQPSTTSRLGLAGPVARLVAPGCGGGCSAAESRGRLSSTGGATHSATSSLEASVTGTLSLFPTTTSPDGIVKVTLSSFSLTCDSRATTTPKASADLTYAGTVQYRTYFDDPLLAESSRYGYSSPLPISSSTTNDPLAGVALTTLVGKDAGGQLLRLGDYVQSWSSLTSGAIGAAKQMGNNGASVGLTLPGVFTLTSTPLRTEAESTAGVQLASASCVAGDIR